MRNPYLVLVLVFTRSQTERRILPNLIQKRKENGHAHCGKRWILWKKFCEILFFVLVLFLFLNIRNQGRPHTSFFYALILIPIAKFPVIHDVVFQFHVRHNSAPRKTPFATLAPPSLLDVLFAIDEITILPGAY